MCAAAIIITVNEARALLHTEGCTLHSLHEDFDPAGLVRAYTYTTGRIQISNPHVDVT